MAQEKEDSRRPEGRRGGRPHRPQRLQNRRGGNRPPRGKQGPGVQTRRKSRRAIVFENPQARNYSKSAVESYISVLKANGYEVEREAPNSAQDMVTRASEAMKKKPYLMAVAGGDGAVNLIARTIVGSHVRLGIIPLGQFNNIFRSLYPGHSASNAAKLAISGKHRQIDCARVSGQPFFGSIGLGLLPALQNELTGKSTPRMALSWSRLASRIGSSVKPTRTPVKLDAFRFDLEPLIINVNLLPYSVGLPLAPSALPDDHRFEVTLDMGLTEKPISKFVRDVYKRRERFVDQVRLYRGEEISIGSVKGRMLYVDGELIEVPTAALEVKFYPAKLRICIE